MPRIAPLEERVARYERIMAMRGPEDHPRMSYEEIGAAFDPPLTRERVRQIIAKPPRRPGRPSGIGRRDALRRKLQFWEARRARAKTERQREDAANRVAHFSNLLAQQQ